MDENEAEKIDRQIFYQFCQRQQSIVQIIDDINDRMSNFDEHLGNVRREFEQMIRYKNQKQKEILEKMILLENSIASAILTKFRELNDFSGSDDEESEKSPDGSVDEESSEDQTENGKTGQDLADSTTLEDSDRQSNETLVAGNEESPTSSGYKPWTRRYKGNLVEETEDEQNCAVILEKVALICVIYKKYAAPAEFGKIKILFDNRTKDYNLMIYTKNGKFNRLLQNLKLSKTSEVQVINASINMVSAVTIYDLSKSTDFTCCFHLGFETEDDKKNFEEVYNDCLKSFQNKITNDFVFVPNNMIGHILGRNDSKIKLIMKNSDAIKYELIRHGERGEDFIFTGTEKQVGVAIKLVKQIMILQETKQRNEENERRKRNEENDRRRRNEWEYRDGGRRDRFGRNPRNYSNYDLDW